MSYLWAGQEPAVRWLAGVAPGRPGPDGAVQLALSEEVADPWCRRWRHVHGRHADRTAVPVLVTGVFERGTRADPVWTARPEVLRPRVGAAERRVDDRGGWAAVGSLAPRPPAPRSSRPASPARSGSPSTRRRWTIAAPRVLVTQLAALEAAPALLLAPGPHPNVTSQLTSLLTLARERVAATWSQANVVLAGPGVRGRAGAPRRRRAPRAPPVAGAAHRARPRATPRRHRRESRRRVGWWSSASAPRSAALGLVVAPGAVTWLWVVVVVRGRARAPRVRDVTAARSDTSPRSDRPAPPAPWRSACAR